MPRRPRPANRVPPKGVGPKPHVDIMKKKPRKIAAPEPNAEDSSDSEVAEELVDEFMQGSSSSNPESEEGDEEMSDVHDDADAPRIVQWEDDDENFITDEDKQGEGVSRQLENSLHELPLGALRRARQAVVEAEVESENASDSNTDNESALDGRVASKLEKVPKVEWSIKRRDDISKRRSKHAPTEVSSKRPVTRKRQVVEVPKMIPRDPRFLPMTGEFMASKFQQNYAFLTERHKTELDTLRDTLKIARRKLPTAPRNSRYDQEQEVYRLEQAVKRAESTVNKDRLDRIEREALAKVSKEEQEKRKQGKKEWYLKDGDKRQLVTKARYEALAKDGGQRAVKRAIEKKQKKVNQKEKRSRPFGKKRGSEEGHDPREQKRRRF